jgi:hypothetical protein
VSDETARFLQAATELYTSGYANGLAHKGKPYTCPAIPIMVWPFHEAPPALRALSRNGGDEDWLALLPDDDVPQWMDEGGPYGCCSVDEHRLPDGRLVVIGCHA